MAFDEAVLETLGLAPLWVRRTVRVAEDGDGTEPASDMPVLEPTTMQESNDAPGASHAGASGARTATGDGSGGLPQRVAGASDERLAAQRQADAPSVVPAASAHEHAPTAVETLDWEALEARVASCESCRLCERRTRTVFGVGDREADWMLVGEAPGEQEDKQGEPFVGQAGKLLDSMLRSLSLARGQNVYIANVVKCRPPSNRNPEPDEVASCEPYLRRQVALVKPKLIVALGRVAAQNLLETDATISSLRGRVHRYQDVPVVVTYHPAYLLRSLHDKAKAWADLCLADETYRQRIAEQAGE